MTVERAEKNCRKAWKNSKAKFAWCCHHEMEIELLTEPAEHRIDYIVSNKPHDEKVTRLNNFRPFRGKLPAEVAKASQAYDKAWQAYDKKLLAALHEKDVPDHTWNGKSIFE